MLFNPVAYQQMAAKLPQIGRREKRGNGQKSVPIVQPGQPEAAPPQMSHQEFSVAKCGWRSCREISLCLWSWRLLMMLVPVQWGCLGRWGLRSRLLSPSLHHSPVITDRGPSCSSKPPEQIFSPLSWLGKAPRARKTTNRWDLVQILNSLQRIHNCQYGSFTINW